MGITQTIVFKPVRVLSVEVGKIAAAESEDVFTCPNDLQQLSSLLLKDLPAYSNRIIQRTQDINQAAGIENYILTAGEAELEPQKLPRLQYDRLDETDPEQIFFTVLERQYINGKIVDLQTYHWLFLTQTKSGWRTVILFSRFGNSRQNPPTPPRETTNGIIGQGVQLWLRDCRAKSVSS
ncbi:MAG: hypothetical protein AAFO95_11165 [Cyanobacteria bacterium J06600_6]